MTRLLRAFLLILPATIWLLAVSCSEGESYSDLLDDENKATNWWLANHKVCTEIPTDSVLLYGEDAPFYKMDKDGYIYMQVVNPGDMESRAKTNDVVYFRFMRQNIKNLWMGVETPWEGNADDLSLGSVGNTSFVYGNTLLPTTTQFGLGVQLPLQFLGYNCEVNMVLRSYYGFSLDQSRCIPYIYNIKYYRAEY